MMTEEKLRLYIRGYLNEAVNNYIKKEEETATKKLTDKSKSQVLGDPLDVKLNQMADDFGSDEKNSPTVSVTAGAKKGGTDFTTGQHKANFSDKTKLAK